ncbi:MAG: DMT family transporter [Bacillota bacterium]|nr:DMT family transporter [Bacillota bacterium]
MEKNGKFGFGLLSGRYTVILLIILWIIWGFNWVVMRMANDYFPPLFFVACRFSIGAAALLIVCALRGKLIPPRRYWIWIALTGVLMMSFNNLMVQICTKFIGAGLTALLDYMQSIFVCVLAAFLLKERFTARKLLGIVCSVAGLMILLNVDMTQHIWAVFLALGAALIWAVSNIIIKLKLPGCDMLQYTGWQMACGSFVLMLYLLIGQPDAAAEGIKILTDSTSSMVMGIGVLLYNGLVASALAFVIWNYILTHMEAGQASIAVMAVPAVGVLSGVLVLDEPMSLSIALGMALIFAGVLAVLGTGRPE